MGLRYIAQAGREVLKLLWDYAAREVVGTKPTHEQERRTRIRQVLQAYGLQELMNEQDLIERGFLNDIIDIEHALGTGAAIPGTEKDGYVRRFGPYEICFRRVKDSQLYELYVVRIIALNGEVPAQMNRAR